MRHLLLLAAAVLLFAAGFAISLPLGLFAAAAVCGGSWWLLGEDVD